MFDLFFSYSRKDEEYRKKIENHLSSLKIEKTIKTWHDRHIEPGMEFDHEINRHLISAHIILLLISADFLASEYCVEKEMEPAMKRYHNDNDDVVVIPIILRPCDWESLPLASLQAVPLNGKPISKFADPEEAFREIAQEIRKTVKSLKLNRKSSNSNPSQITKVDSNFNLISRAYSRNLQINKEFSEHDKDLFLTRSFDYFAEFFENSLNKIQQDNPDLNTSFRRIDANRFTSAIYRNGQKVCSCTIRPGGFTSNGITFSHSDTAYNNGYNELLSIVEDKESLLLRASGMGGFLGTTQNLSQKEGAEYLWGLLISHLQQKY